MRPAWVIRRSGTPTASDLAMPQGQGSALGIDTSARQSYYLDDNGSVIPLVGAGSGVYEKSGTVPSASTFTAVHGSGATLTDTATGLQLVGTTSGATVNYKLYKKAKPSSTFTLIGRIANQSANANFAAAHLVLRNDTSGKFVVWGIAYSSGILFQYGRYTNLTTFSSSPYTETSYGREGWFRLVVDGTNITYGFCVDGLNWRTCGSEAISAWVGTIDSIGIGCETISTSSYATFGCFEAA